MFLTKEGGEGEEKGFDVVMAVLLHLVKFYDLTVKDCLA